MHKREWRNLESLFTGTVWTLSQLCAFYYVVAVRHESEGSHFKGLAVMCRFLQPLPATSRFGIAFCRHSHPKQRKKSSAKAKMLRSFANPTSAFFFFCYIFKTTVSLPCSFSELAFFSFNPPDSSYREHTILYIILQLGCNSTSPQTLTVF